MRVFDAKRMKYFYKRLNENKFYELIERIKNLLPKRESGLTSNLSRNIIPQKSKKDNRLATMNFKRTLLREIFSLKKFDF